MIQPLFDGVIEQLTRGLGYTSQRHGVLARNLANVETPGYKARDLVFDDHLRPLLQATAPDEPLPQHPIDPSERRPRLVLAGEGPVKPDGNDIHLDGQMSKLAQNSLFHNALVQVLVGRFSTMKQAISGRV